MKRRTWKRLIAILMCLLMVTTLIENVSYKPAADDSGSEVRILTGEDSSALLDSADDTSSLYSDVASGTDAASQTVVLPTDQTELLNEEEEKDDPSEASTEASATEEQVYEEEGEEINLLDGEENIVREGTSDITGFLTDVEVKNGSTVVERDWKVDSSTTYNMAVGFAEDDTTLDKQFNMNDRTFTYTLPKGINVVEFKNPIDITVSVGGTKKTLHGTTYDCVKVGDRYVITGSFEDDQDLKNAKDTEFYFDLKVTFDGDITSLDFGGGKVYPITVDSSSSVSVTKSQNGFDKQTGTMNYKIMVTSVRANTNISVHDVLEGTALSMGSITSITSSLNGNVSGTVNTTTNSNGFDIVIPSMSDKEVITIDYTGIIDLSKIKGSGTVEETKNTVSVTSDQDNTPDEKSTDFAWQLGFVTLSKSGVVADKDNTDGTRTITYEAVYNNDQVTPVSGTVIKDTISANNADVTYPEGFKITVEKYKGSSLIGSTEVTPAIADAGKSWSYTIDEGSDKTPYKYIFKYSIDVDYSSATKDVSVNNNISDDKGHSGGTSGTITVPGKITINKGHNKINLEDGTVEWFVTISVPEGGIKKDAVITDTLPNTYIGTKFVDSYVPGSIVLPSELNASVSNTDSELILKLESDIPNNSATPYDITFSYKTYIDQTWLDYSMKNGETWRQSHSNTVKIVDGKKEATATDTVTIIKPSVKKSRMSEKNWWESDSANGTITEYNGRPIYKFLIEMSSVGAQLDAEGYIEVTDTFDKNFNIISDSGFEIGLTNDPYKAPETLSAGVVTKSGDTFTFKLDKSYFPMNGSEYFDTYRLTYYMAVTNDSDMNDLIASAVSEPNNTLTLTNTAMVLGADDSVSVEYTYDPAKKTLTNADKFSNSIVIDRSEVFPEYKIVLNEGAVELNGGKPTTATDTFTNLAIIYDSITVSPSNSGITWDMSGNKITFKNIPDSTKVEITYKARITGEKDNNNLVTFNNSFEYAGGKDSVVKTANVGADSGGSASIKRLQVYKYRDGNLDETLNGAEFWLYGPDGKRMNYIGTTTPVVIITGEDNDGDGEKDGDGIAWISQKNIDFLSSNEVNKNEYTLKEVKAPEGYMLDSTVYRFKLIKGNNPNYSNYEYVNDDSLKIRNRTPGIWFQKVDEDGKPLAGAEFTVYDSTNNVVATAVSDEDGYVSVSDLGEGTYTIKETKAPSDDYALDKKEYTITFSKDADGNLKQTASTIPNQIVNKKKDEESSTSLDLEIKKTIDSNSDITGFTNKFSFDIAEIDEGQATAFSGGTAPSGTSTLETAEYVSGNTYKATLNYKKNADGTGDMGTHYYIVTENVSGLAGIKDSKDAFLVTVEVKDDGDELSAEIKDRKKLTGGKVSSATEIVFDNTSTEVTWKPEAVKKLYNDSKKEDMTFAQGDFTFTLTETSTVKHGTALDNQKNVPAATCSDASAGSSVLFGEITYTGKDAGKTYTYKIAEDDVVDSQVKKDETYYTVSVSITRNADGSLKCTPTILEYKDGSASGTPATSMSFLNKRTEGEGSFVPKAVKKLDGKSDMAGFTFDFKLEKFTGSGVTTAAGAYASNSWSGVETKTTGDSGIVSFSEISYSTAGDGEGTYFYRITEVKKAAYTGIAFDEGTVIIKVDVAKNATTGELSVSETYSYFDKNGNARAGSSASEAYFNNISSGEAKLELSAKKELAGATLSKDQFTFTVSEPSGQNKLVSNPVSVKNDANGSISFGEIAAFDMADIGKTFTFYVDEDRTNKSYGYDENYYRIVVSIVRDTATGGLKLQKQIYEVEYDKGNYAADTKATKVFDTEDSMFNKESLIFNNSIIYSDLAVQPAAIKVLEDFGTGVTLKEDQFTFKFEQIDSDKASAKPVSGGVNLTAKNDANGSVRFEPFTIEADKLNEGDNKLYYRMYETGSVSGFKTDDTVYIIYLIANKTNDGKVNVTPRYKKGYAGSYSSVYATMNNVSHVYEFTASGDNGLPFVFTNEINTGELKLQAVKKMKETGLTVAAGTFSFTAKRVDISGGETLTETNKSIIAGQSGVIEFTSGKKYTPEDVEKTKTAPYVYEITEFAGDKTKFKFDDTKYRAYVTFDYDSEGAIVPTVSYKKVTGTNEADVTAAEFTNSVVSSVSLKPEAKKTLVDENDKPVSLSNGMFTFELATDEAFTKDVETKVNDGEHVFFSEKTFDSDFMGDETEKTYTFYTREVIPDPVQEGYEYDESVYKTEVKIIKDAATGELKLEKTLSKKAKGESTYSTVDSIMPQFDNKIDSKEIKAWPINIRKNLSNNQLPPTQFAFKVVQVADAKGTAVSGAEESTVTTSLDSGVAQYDANLTRDDEYFFKITELGGTDPLVVYDKNVYIIRVSVDGEGKESTSIVNKNGSALSSPETYIGALPFTNSVSIKLNKLDADGKAIEGATLKLTDSGSNAQTITGAAMSGGTWKSTKSAVSFDDVKVGEIYTFSEVAAPYGYKLADPVYFTVKAEDGKYVLYTGTSKSNINTAVNGATVSMTDEKSAIAIVKTDASGEILKGAHFKVTTTAGKSVNKTLDDIVVTPLGMIPLNPIDYFTADQVYMLTETVAPTGFKLADKPVYFKIDANNVIYTGSSASDLKRVDGDTITFVDNAGEFTVKKVDAAKTGTRVAGAELKITGAANSITVNGSKTDSVTFTSTAGTDKVFKLDDFAEGTYTLSEEKAPEGYEKAKPISFMITDDKKLMVDEDGTGTYKEAKDAVLTMKDTKVTTIKVRKVTAGTDNLLAGAVMAIKSADGKQVVDSGFVTNRSAAKEFMSSSFEKETDYILSEVSAPSGYTLTDETVTFKLDDEGVLWIKTGTTYKKSADNTITLENVARIPVSKVAIAGGPELPGAKLKIVDSNDEIVSGTDANGKNVVYSWTSGSKPYMIDVRNFKVGEVYRLVEITAPKGYDVAEDISFRIDTSGKIYVNADGSGDFKPATGITMLDEASDVTFSKVDATNMDELPGAKLTITDENGNTVKDSSGKVLTWTSGTAPKVVSISSFEEGKIYKMTEITAPDGYEVAESIFFKVVRDEKGRYEVQAGKSADTLEKVTGKTVIMEDKPTEYKVTISKVDITTDEEVAGAHIQILENGKVITEWDSTTKAKEIKNLKPGVTYTLRETVAPEGYTITTDTTFTLKKDGSLDTSKTTASYKSSAKGKVKLLVKDSITSMHFTKYGYVRELCAENGSETKPLKGAKFAAYEVNEDGSLGKAVAMATSKASGEVVFDGIPKGRYAIKEISAPEGYKLLTEVYYADVTDKAFDGIKDADGNKIASNSIINDFERGDIEFTKVSEMNKEKKLADSTYELIREEDDGTERVIATAVSDKDGVVRFKGVKANTKYKVREVDSPEGFYVSKKPIEVTISVDENGVKNMELVNDGDGTMEIDKNGNITWLEPSVVVSFLKTDEEGNPLAGATLAVYNSRGEIMKDAYGNEMLWKSTESPSIVADIFNDGETYTLAEIEAPEGYELAEPVSFEIPADHVGPQENRIVSVTMKDKKKPKDEEKEEKPEEPETPKQPDKEDKNEPKKPEVTPAKKEPVTEAPKTGDNSPVKAVTTTMLGSLVGIAALALTDRKRKKKER